MITISEAVDSDFQTIQAIAYRTWPDTYGEILSKEQIDYMLDLFYSTKAFHENVNQKRHHFLLAIDTDVCVGFASYEHNYTQKPITRIHKIYILPETQGKGIGKLLLDKIESFAKENHCNTLSLNVNRYNKALTFYQKSGFKIVLEEDILLDHGYKMEDYRMEKEL